MNKRLVRFLNFHDLKCLICGYVASELWEITECDFRATVHVCESCGRLPADEIFEKVLN